jgi:hypothetical protein
MESLFPMVPLLALLSAIWYRSYLPLKIFRALLLGMLGQVGAYIFLALNGTQFLFASPLQKPWNSRVDTVAFIAFLLLVALGLGVLVKVYRALALDSATDLERTPNAQSLRAWLGPANVIAAAGIVAAASYALGWRPWLTGAVTLAVLLAYPAFNCLLSRRAAMHADDPSAEERRRVLALVESGKISAADGAELISALGQSYAAGAFRQDDLALSGNRRMMLLGSAVVLVGFFLPWFTVNVGQITRDPLNYMMRELLPGFGTPASSDLVLRVSGGDIAHGLGWILMFLAIGAAVLPLLWPTRPANRPIQRAISFVALVAGTILLLYIFSGYVTSRSGLDLEVGLPVVMAGYAITWIWTVREYVLGSRRPALSSLAAAH